MNFQVGPVAIKIVATAVLVGAVEKPKKLKK